MNQMMHEEMQALWKIQKLAEGFEFRDFKFSASLFSEDGWMPRIQLRCEWIQPDRELITGVVYMHSAVLTDEKMFMLSARGLMVSVMFKAMETEARISLAKA